MNVYAFNTEAEAVAFVSAGYPKTATNLDGTPNGDAVTLRACDPVKDPDADVWYVEDNEFLAERDQARLVIVDHARLHPVAPPPISV